MTGRAKGQARGRWLGGAALAALAVGPGWRWHRLSNDQNESRLAVWTWPRMNRRWTVHVVEHLAGDVALPRDGADDGHLIDHAASRATALPALPAQAAVAVFASPPRYVSPTSTGPPIRRRNVPSCIAARVHMHMYHAVL